MIADFLDIIKQRNKLFKRWKQSPDKIILKNSFTNLRNQLNKKIKRQKNNYYYYKLTLNNKLIFGCLAKNLRLENDVTIKTFFKDDELTIPNRFADTFIHSIKYKFYILFSPIFRSGILNVSFYMVAVSVQEVKNIIILSLNDKKTPVMDLLRAADVSLFVMKYLI